MVSLIGCGSSKVNANNNHTNQIQEDNKSNELIENNEIDGTRESEILSFHKTIEVQHKNKMGISLYYAEENKAKPTIFYLSASVSDRRVYEHIYHYLVRQGYTVVGLSTEGFASDFMTYHFYDAITYAKQVCQEKNICNEKKIGLVGHSSGAGVLPSVAYKLFVEDGLGEEGRFVFGAAPWIDFQYESYMKLPKDTNFVTQVFIHDHTTDPRIALDMYKLMDVNHKTFMMVKGDSNHGTPFNQTPIALIHQGIFEPLSNIAKFSFEKRDKDKSFANHDIVTQYLHIEAEGTLPSDEDYSMMLKKFKESGSSYGCVTYPNYMKNPREKECLNYVNEL
jgi:hypothetical protein